MARRLILGCVLLLFGVLASCSDSTAPTETLSLVVSPDTFHFVQYPPYVTYTERIVSVARTKVWIAPLELEAEVSPGQWNGLGDPNNLYLQAASWLAVTNADLSGVDSVAVGRLTPGRYRLRQRYQLTEPDGTQATSQVLVATSNPFVVAP